MKEEEEAEEEMAGQTTCRYTFRSGLWKRGKDVLQHVANSLDLLQ